jgi:hypothetical protein
VAHLEPHDELGLPWDDLADGRVHRLVKGREFVRGAELVEEAAANAAARLERVVRTYREIRHGTVYLWVQFVDHEVVIGEPCPCGNGQLLQVNQNFAECASCKATVALLRPKRQRQEHDEAVTEDEPLLVGLLGAQTASRNGKRATRRAVPEVVDPKSDLTRLGAFTKVELYAVSADERRERMCGQALGPRSQPTLVVVDFPRVAGSRIEDAAYPGGWRHTVWSVPITPIGRFVRLDELRKGTPALRIDDPLADFTATPSAGVEQEAGPPSHLSQLEDVKLFPQGGEGKKRESFFGDARTLDGERVLILVRFSQREDGATVLEDPSRPPQELRAVPLEPFQGVIDTDALFSPSPSEEDSEQHVESVDVADTERDGANGVIPAGDSKRARDPNKAERRTVRPKGTPKDAAPGS